MRRRKHRRPEALAADADGAARELARDGAELVLGRVSLVTRPAPDREDERCADGEQSHVVGDFVKLL